MVRLLPEITFDKRPLPGSGWSYNFRHRTLGALGRILLQDLPGGRGTHVTCKVAGDPADPRTVECCAVFEPLGLKISRQIEQAIDPCTEPRPVVPPPPPVQPAEVVESKLMQCRTCDAFVAMLVFAPGAMDAGWPEDYARTIYPQYVRHGLPTWIIGPALGLEPEDPADILQVWPVRKPLQRHHARTVQPAPEQARHAPLLTGKTMATVVFGSGWTQATPIASSTGEYNWFPTSMESGGPSWGHEPTTEAPDT